MTRTAKRLAKDVLNIPSAWLCRREFEAQAFTRLNERPVELAFVFEKLRDVCPETVLDVGSGTTALPHMMRTCGFVVTATDNVRDYWPGGAHNRHYHVIDDDITQTRLSGTYDFITCTSVLEHIERPDDAIRNMLSLLNPNGHLLLTFPYSERSYVHNVYRLPGSSYGQDAPFVTQSYSRAELDRWFGGDRTTIVDQEYWQLWSGEHWTVGEQIVPPIPVSAADRHQLTCVLVRRR